MAGPARLARIAAAGEPGEIIGTTRLLGGFVTPKAGDAGPLWAVNGNMGDMYLFTADGLFVATLFKDVRQGKSWAMPTAERGMILNDLTLHDENFWPSMTQTEDGQVYLVDGANTSLVRVDGLESIRRLPNAPCPSPPTICGRPGLPPTAGGIAAEEPGQGGADGRPTR